jgi:hypothetical protein
MLEDCLQLALLQIERLEKIVRTRHLTLPGAPEYKSQFERRYRCERRGLSNETTVHTIISRLAGHTLFCGSQITLSLLGTPHLKILRYKNV